MSDDAPAPPDKTLDLSEKNLGAVDASKIRAGLQHIDLHGNSLATLDVNLFDKCQESLTQLDLYGNKPLKELPAGVLGGLKGLTVLNAFNCVLKKLPADIGGLEALEEVNFAANKLMMTTDAHFLMWRNVKVLNMYDNNLVRMGSLAPLVALEELRISGNNLEEMPALCADCPITIYEIHKNRVAKIDDEYFKATPKLSRLSIWGNALTELPASLLQCADLVGVQAQEMPLASLPSGAWPAGLETLFVQDKLDAPISKLTKLPKELAACQKLKRVNLGGLQLDADAAKIETAMRALVLSTSSGDGIFWNSKNERLEQAKGHK